MSNSLKINNSNLLMHYKKFVNYTFRRYPHWLSLISSSWSKDSYKSITWIKIKLVRKYHVLSNLSWVRCYKSVENRMSSCSNKFTNWRKVYSNKDGIEWMRLGWMTRDRSSYWWNTTIHNKWTINYPMNYNKSTLT